MRAFMSALIDHADRSGWRFMPIGAHDHHNHTDDGGVYWRGCLRLPLCLADSTFVVDNIRCQHSPPR